MLSTLLNSRRQRRRPQGRRSAQMSSRKQPPSNNAGVGHLYSAVPFSRNLVDLTGNWTIVPPEVRTCLPYHEELAVTSGTYFADRVYSLNSLYDPDVTSTGHQPMGFDQWGTFYNHYRVIQTSLNFRVNNAATASGLSVYLVVNDDPTPITSTPVAGEAPYTQELIVGSATGMDIGTRKAVFNIPQLAGRTLAQYRAEENYSAFFGASPAQQFYLHVFMRSIDGATTLDANLTIYFAYLSELYERKKLPLS